MPLNPFLTFLLSVAATAALTPRPPSPKPAALEDFDLPTADSDRPLPVLFGTAEITGPNVCYYGDYTSTRIKQRSLFSSTTVGFRYYMGLQFGLCYGPVDELSKIRVGEKDLWSGSVTASTNIDVNEPDLFGGEKREGGMSGRIAVMMGDSAQTANAYLVQSMPGPAPAFRGMFGLVWERDIGGTSRGYIGNTPFLKPWAITAKRITSGWYQDAPWYTEKAEIPGKGMNGAHIIYQCLTDPRFGMGASVSQFNDASWRAVADTLYDEGVGLNLLWNQPIKIQEFISIVLDHISGALALDPATNEYVLKLIRADYDASSLDVLDQSTGVLDSDEVQSWGETVNEITVTYTDPDTLKSTPVTVQDLGNIRAQGAVVSEQLDYSGFHDFDLAQNTAGLELRRRSTPLHRGTYLADRNAWTKTLGDVFKLNWPPRNISDVVCRVMAVDKGTLSDGRFRIEYVEDIYSLSAPTYVTRQPPAAEPAPLPVPTDVDTNPNVLSVTLTSPPSAPADGDRYFVAAPAGGPWQFREGQIAEYDDETDTWFFITVPPGPSIYDEESGGYYTSDGAGGIVPVGNPTPVITEISPDSAAAGGGDFFLTITGTDFLSSSSVFFGDKHFVPEFVSSTTLRVLITAADITDGGTVNVTVQTPLPGGGTSNAVVFTVQGNFADIALLLGFEGSDGSTVFVDESNNAFTVTANGTVQIDTSQAKYGGSSGLFDGNSDYLSIADSSAFDVGSSNATGESFVRFNGDPSALPAGQCFMAHYLNTGDQRGWFFRYLPNDTLQFAYSTNGVDSIGINGAWAPAADTWYHVAWCRNGSTLRLFVDGLIVASGDVAGVTIFDSNHDLEIGRLASIGFENFFFNGHMDEVRFNPNAAFYTQPFTPPPAPHPRS